MQTLTKQREKEVIRLMAKEFLEYRLGVEASNENVQRLSQHIADFEKEIQSRKLKKSLKKTVYFKSINQLHFSKRTRAC